MLETTWFVLWGALWAIYFILDGFDLGAAILSPFLAKNEQEKKIVYSALGPFWDANEVWLVIAGGVTFAAFPALYAGLFSSFYAFLLLVLLGLIIRNVALEFRGKLKDPAWRSIWDCSLFVGSFLAAFFLGMVFANIFRGIDIDRQAVFVGTLSDLFNGYAILGGVFFLMIFLFHGSLWLAIKSEGDFSIRASRAARMIWGVLAIVGLTFVVCTWFATSLFDNYVAHPGLFLVPLALVFSFIVVRHFLLKADFWKAWIFSGVSIFFTVCFGMVGLYPNMLPSLIEPANSLTAFNSASSPLTLKIMLSVAVVTIPLISIYQIYGYRLFSSKIREKDLSSDELY